MAYTTKTLVRKATGMSDATLIPDTYIDAKITYADGVINGKIGDVYTLPLASTPDLIALLSLEISAALLYMDEYGEETEDADKGWKKRLDWAMKILDDIQSQKMKLYGADGVELTRSTLRNPSFYPNDTSSAVGATDSTAPQIKMSDTF